MVQHALERGYEVVGVCREQSVHKLARFEGRITVIAGATNDRDVIRRAVEGCDGVLTVLAPWGVQQYSSGTAQAVLDFAPEHARLVFSCGWHITRDGKDVYSKTFLTMVKAFGWVARAIRFGELDDQVEACRRIFASDRAWTVVRGSDLEEGESEGLPVWSRHVGDPILREQPNAACRLRVVHGGRADEPGTDPRSARDRWPPHSLGDGSRCVVAFAIRTRLSAEPTSAGGAAAGFGARVLRGFAAPFAGLARFAGAFFAAGVGLAGLAFFAARLATRAFAGLRLAFFAALRDTGLSSSLALPPSRRSSPGALSRPSSSACAVAWTSCQSRTASRVI